MNTLNINPKIQNNSTHVFAFNSSIKLHSSKKIRIRYIKIYRLFIKQPFIQTFTKRYRSKHRNNLLSKIFCLYDTFS